jgi:hypothetical protein
MDLSGPILTFVSWGKRISLPSVIVQYRITHQHFRGLGSTQFGKARSLTPTFGLNASGARSDDIAPNRTSSLY